MDILTWLTADPWGVFTLSVVALGVAVLSLIGNVILYRRMR